MHPTWNEISETREREREISNCAGHREEFSSKKIIRYQGEEGKKNGKRFDRGRIITDIFASTKFFFICATRPLIYRWDITQP